MDNYLEIYLKNKGVHSDDIQEILEAELEDTIDYIRHDLWVVYQEYLKHIKEIE